jgi:hypothetical protein
MAQGPTVTFKLAHYPIFAAQDFNDSRICVKGRRDFSQGVCTPGGKHRPDDSSTPCGKLLDPSGTWAASHSGREPLGGNRRGPASGI